jgi:cytochrome oxidase Cu insertion factor (SCO1/SenC/PrrC family)
MAKRKNRKKRGQSSNSAEVMAIRSPKLLVAGSAIIALAVVVIFVFFSGLQTPPEAVQKQPNQAVQQQKAEDTTLASLPVAPQVGAMAPDFTLRDTDGNQVSLSDYRGRPVVVNFFHTY